MLEFPPIDPDSQTAYDSFMRSNDVMERRRIDNACIQETHNGRIGAQEIGKYSTSIGRHDVSNVERTNVLKEAHGMTNTG